MRLAWWSHARVPRHGSDAAPSDPGVEHQGVPLVVRALRDSSQQLQVQVAHGVGVLPCQPMERAVAQHDSARTVRSGFVPVVLENLLQRTGAGAQGPAGVPAIRSSVSPAGSPVRVDSSIAVDQQLAGEVVAAFGNGDRDLAGRSAVELGRASRPGPVRPVSRLNSTVSRPSSASRSRWKAAVLRGEPQRLGGLVPADRCIAAGDVLEQGPADRLVQRADGRHPIRQRPLLHTHTVKYKTLDERSREPSNVTRQSSFREESAHDQPSPDPTT